MNGRPSDSLRQDAAFGFLAPALNPGAATSAFGLRDGRIEDVEVVRHKPGRRCLIRYHIEFTDGRQTAWLGKVRVRGADRSTYDLMHSLRSAGFDEDASDGVAVPEPIALVPEFRMWLQRHLPGQTLEAALPRADGDRVVTSVADAIHKLHRLGPPPRRSHGVEDEVAILRSRLEPMAEGSGESRGEIRRVLAACERLALTLLERPVRPVHRDFYPAQVLASGRRLYLLDFDLYAWGDPALDAGNYLAHVLESTLRTTGKVDAFARVEEAFVERFVTLSPGSRPAVDAYLTLSLARHIQLSTLFPDRRHTTRPLVRLVEARLTRWLPPARTTGFVSLCPST